MAKVEPRYWVYAGDLALLTFKSGDSILGMFTVPPGTTPGWVLADGVRIPTRPRTLDTITFVYTTSEHTTEDEDHDRDTEA
jgi:hypothetical protein